MKSVTLSQVDTIIREDQPLYKATQQKDGRRHLNRVAQRITKFSEVKLNEEESTRLAEMWYDRRS